MSEETDSRPSPCRGRVVRTGSGIHFCSPPMGGSGLRGDRTGLPYGSIWECECGNRFKVDLDQWGKTWKRRRRHGALVRWLLSEPPPAPPSPSEKP